MFDLIDMIIVRPLVNLLFVIYNFVGDFGLAIIIFTIIVKFAMWPLVKKQLHQTRLMKKIQPELAEIKKNCKGNRQLESLQMMDLYKRNNIKPFRSMLTLIIQLPIFIALFTAINVMVQPIHTDATVRSVEKSAYSFIAPLPKINDLIETQTAYFDAKKADEAAKYTFEPKLFGLVDLSATAGFSSVSAVMVLLFALGASAVQFLLARQQMPKKDTKKRTFKQILKDTAAGGQADQSELNSMVTGQMSKLMPIMMLFIMINLPGALVFYYLLTNTITAIQQKIVLGRDASEMEELADKKIIKELNQIEEAEIVKDGSKNKQHITKISAKNNKRRKK
jgi:YidC/Oxa1 family membrane protein insertase